MKRIIILTAIFIATFSSAKAQFYAPSGSEVYATGGDQWITAPYETDRTATPGYFSGVGTASFIDATDEFHINGYQKHYADAANQAYTFVVGSGTDLRTLSISGTISASSEVATAWIVGDPTTTADPTNGNALHSITTVGTGIVAVSDAGQWDWIATNTDGATVTVSIPDMSSYSLASNLRLVGWDGAKWIDLSGGTATATTNTENSTLSGTIPTGVSIEAIAIGTAAAPLPVTFGAISAVIKNGLLMIDWSTVFEQNNDRFIIELSRDGQNFFAIDSIKTQALEGNSSAIIKYHYEKALVQVTSMSVSIWAVAILLMLLIVMAFGGRYKLKNGVVAAFAFMVMLASISCAKRNDAADLKTASGNYFVKITQVDIDGTRVSSKIVKAVAE